MLSFLVSVMLIGICFVAVPLFLMALFVGIMGALARSVSSGVSSLFK